MAQPDLSILQGIRPIQIDVSRLESPVNQMANMYQLQSAQQANQLNALKLQEMQRTANVDARLKQLYSRPDFDVTSPDAAREVMAISPATGMSWLAEARKAEQERATVAKAKAETEAANYELKRKKLDQAIRDIASFNSLEEINAHMEEKIASGELPADRASVVRATLPKDDAGISAWKTQTLKSLLSAKDQMELNKPPAPTNLAKLQQERTEIARVNPKDPRIKDYDNAIRKETQWKPEVSVTVAAPTLSKSAIDTQADRFLLDGTLPPLGMGKEGAANRTAIMNRAAEMAKERGINPDRVTQLENKANASALTQLNKQETMVGAFEKNFTKNADLVVKLSSAKDNVGVPLLQKWINAGKSATSGDPELRALGVAIKAVQNEYGKIVSGSMGNTAVAVSEIKRMEGMLNAAQTPAEVMSVIDTMKQETQNRMAGFKEQKAELTGGMRGSTAAPTSAKPLANRKPLADIFK